MHLVFFAEKNLVCFIIVCPNAPLVELLKLDLVTLRKVVESIPLKQCYSFPFSPLSKATLKHMNVYCLSELTEVRSDNRSLQILAHLEIRLRHTFKDNLLLNPKYARTAKVWKEWDRNQVWMRKWLGDVVSTGFSRKWSGDWIAVKSD